MFEHIHAAKGCLDLKDENESLLNGKPAQKVT